MAIEPRWTQHALKDLLAIIRYIAADNPAAARKLHSEVDRKVSALSEHPRLYRTGRVAGTREMVVGRSYLVIYRETTAEITILRMLHGAQRWP